MSESKLVQDIRKRLKIAKAERNSAQSRVEHLTEMLLSELIKEGTESD